MHAFLITGSDLESRINAIKKELLARRVDPFDCIYIEAVDEHITIEQIRAIQSPIHLKPIKETTAVIILGSDTMTPQAQNALLKTLEEPPPHAILFLETQSASLLLPTIASRCLVIHLGLDQQMDKSQDASFLTSFFTILESTPGKKLAFVDNVSKSRKDALVWVERATNVLHRYFVTYSPQVPNASIFQSQASLASLLRRLLLARMQLSVNVNPKLVLDALMLR